jgi:ankyrin repeat protein
MNPALPDRHPVFRACQQGDLETVRRFLADGGSVYAESTSNPSLVAYALSGKQTAVIKLLVEFGLDVNLPFNGPREVPLMHAVSNKIDDLVGYLLEIGADPNARDEFGGTALKRAAAGGEVRYVQSLLNHGANLSAVDNHGADAMQSAARGNRVEVLQFLRDAGANLDSRDKSGATPLICAAKVGSYDGVKWLLDNGAAANAVDEDRRDAVFYARRNRHTAIVELLEQSLADSTSPLSATPVSERTSL